MSLSGRLSTDESIVGKVGVLNTIEGKSAYEIALLNGFEGTEEEWIASLKGEKGDTYILTEADKEEIADIVAVDNLQESAEKYIDSVIEEKDLEVTRTAKGNAITIDSANAPLQNLKLYGKTTQDGTPTPTSPIELKSVGDSGSFEVGVYGKNLLEVTLESKTINGVTLTVNADKSVTIKGTATQSFSFGFSSKFYIPKGKYKMIGDNLWSLELRIPNKETKVYHLKSFEVVDDGCEIYPYRWLSAGSIYDETIHPMLVLESVTDETYEPCNKQSITFTDTLRGIGDIADEKDFARGVTTQRFAEVDLSTLTWNYGTYWRSLNLREVIDIDVISPKFLATNYKVQSWYAERNGAVMCIDNYGGICVFNTDAETKPTGTLVYALATPIETPISETELNAYRQLHTNKPNTTILSEADMEVDYYINKPNAQAIGNIHSQINKDYFKLQQAIISTGGNV